VQKTLQASLSLLIVTTMAASAEAQQTNRPVDETTFSKSRLFDRQRNYWHFVGEVELESGDTKIYAEDIEAWVNEDRVVASGNVLFVQGNNRVSADKADFNTKTRLGTFYNASGIANIQPPRQTPQPGAVIAPQLAGQETDVYFFGEEVEKIGPKKYKIKNGGFSTCVQPTPRWDLSADTIVLNIDHYTMLRQAILKVKGVPMLYLPILYYPTKEEDRATGFLIPSYSATTIRGQSIQAPFFWAINRSHDATVAYEWYSNAAQGFDSEYRYNLGGMDNGGIRAHVLSQDQTTYTQADGTPGELPAGRSFELRGSANQQLPGRLRARGRVDYFSSVETMQQVNTNIYDASRSQRSFGVNVNGAWRTYSLNAQIDRSENFYNTTDSVVNGGTPRVNFSRNERPLFRGTYFSTNSEVVHLVRQSHSADTQDPGLTINQDSGLTRFDFAPQMRFPVRRWQWFTINGTAAWRETFWTRSLDPNTIDPITLGPAIVDDPLNRTYFTLAAQTVGPVFTRIFDTPNNGYAERFKHTIEPFQNVTRASAIDDFDLIVKTDGTDTIVGNALSYNYGVNNRFYAKRKTGNLSQAQEILTVTLSQTYYTDERMAQYDRQYATSTTGSSPSHFSPLYLGVRVAPTRDLEGRVSAEFDSKYKELRTISASGSYNWTSRIQTSGSWSQKYFIEGLPGFNDPTYLDHYLNGAVNAHTRDNRFGGLYSFNYNILHSALLQQRLTGFYNAQCCGIAFDYQRYNFNYVSNAPADRRFFLSFSLAGLGNFSPFSGGLSGVPR
jgi:LPS-assembly protein